MEGIMGGWKEGRKEGDKDDVEGRTRGSELRE
jgi:hypothetical protein